MRASYPSDTGMRADVVRVSQGCHRDVMRKSRWHHAEATRAASSAVTVMMGKAEAGGCGRARVWVTLNIG
jgi:hypothetical protein